MDLEDFYKRKKSIIKPEASLTGTEIEHLDYCMKNNPDLLQVSEVANYDVDLS